MSSAAPVRKTESIDSSAKAIPALATQNPTIERASLLKDIRSARRHTLVLLVGIAAVTLWSYWPVVTEMAQKWASDSQYSHAYLVPAFSLYLLWRRHRSYGPLIRHTSWWGVPLLLVGCLLRLAGAYVYFDWLEAVSLLPLLAGTALLLGGRTALRWSWPAIGFLAFMIPLPFRIETALSQPLQGVATTVSTFVLQTIGRPAFSEGHVIIVNDARVGVVEACNGLGMLLLFFALATGVAMLCRRSVLEKLIIVASAVPVAVAANVARITVTSLLNELLGQHWADIVFHDLAGWLMMPLAMGMLGVEMWILSRLFIDVAPPARLNPLSPSGLDRRPRPSTQSRSKGRHSHRPSGNPQPIAKQTSDRVTNGE